MEISVDLRQTDSNLRLPFTIRFSRLPYCRQLAGDQIYKVDGDVFIPPPRYYLAPAIGGASVSIRVNTPILSRSINYDKGSGYGGYHLKDLVNTSYSLSDLLLSIAHCIAVDPLKVFPHDPRRIELGGNGGSVVSTISHHLTSSLVERSWLTLEESSSFLSETRIYAFFLRAFAAEQVRQSHEIMTDSVALS